MSELWDKKTDFFLFCEFIQFIYELLIDASTILLE